MSLTPEQKAIRSKGIGGSEIAAIVGLSPFEGAVDVWLRKTGRADSKDETVDMRRGKHLGPAIVEWYADECGRKVEFYGQNERTFVHSKYPLCIATPDGIADHDIVVEAKSPRRGEDWGPSGTEECPDYYCPQLIWEMAAAGMQKADIVALIYGELRVYRIDWSADLFEALLYEAAKFWRDYVVADRPPPASTSQNPDSALKALYPKNTLGFTIATVEISARCKMLAKIKKAISRLEAKESEYTAFIKEFIGEHDGVCGSFGEISWKKTKDSHKTDWEAVARALNAPKELIEQHTTIKEGSRRFCPKFV